VVSLRRSPLTETGHINAKLHRVPWNPASTRDMPKASIVKVDNPAIAIVVDVNHRLTIANDEQQYLKERMRSYVDALNQEIALVPGSPTDLEHSYGDHPYRSN